MKVHVIQSKNEIMMIVGVSVKNYMIGVLVKMIIYGILVCVIVSVLKHVNILTFEKMIALFKLFH